MKCQWTYGPTQLPWNDHFHTSLACFTAPFKNSKTSEGCVEIVIPWQVCRTIGPLLRDSSWQVLKHSQGEDMAH